MTQIILDGALVDSPWRVAQLEESSGGSHLLLPMANYTASESLQARSDVGVWIAAEDDSLELAEVISTLTVVAVDFPAFTDGRGLSHASTLRTRFGFEGEVRAIGDVRRDQMQQMVQCGINSFAFQEDADLAGALEGLKLFSHNYQSSTRQPNPLFRLR